LPRLLQTSGQALGDRVEATADLAGEALAHAGELLPQSAEQAAQVSLGAVPLLDRFEERAYPFEGGVARVREMGVQPGMDSVHVQIDHLEREVLLALEVVVERAARYPSRIEQGLDSQVVVSALQEHREARLEQPLLCRARHTASE
jgi:hypothetical protein